MTDGFTKRLLLRDRFQGRYHRGKASDGSWLFASDNYSVPAELKLVMEKGAIVISGVDKDLVGEYAPELSGGRSQSHIRVRVFVMKVRRSVASKARNLWPKLYEKQLQKREKSKKAQEDSRASFWYNRKATSFYFQIQQTFVCTGDR